jgi:phospholipid/cholesterol/gamma-HCH transport system permease protein
MIDWLASIGSQVRGGLANLGLQMRTLLAMLRASGGLLRRPRLVTDQVHFIGNYSLVIIAVSGLFVGFVLGLQGYYTLNKYGSEQALGLLVALSLVRELGPVVTALLFAGRAGTSLTAEIGLMKATEQLAGTGAAFLGRGDCHAAISGSVLCSRCAGRICRWRCVDRR